MIVDWTSAGYRDLATFGWTSEAAAAGGGGGSTQYLYITECSMVGYTMAAGVPVAAPQMEPVNEQRLPVSTNPIRSSSFGDETRFVMVEASIAVCLAWGGPDDTPPVAVVTAQRLPANKLRIYGVQAGGAVSVIQATA